MLILQNEAYGHWVLIGCSTASLGCCLSASWLHVACAIMAQPPCCSLPAVLRPPLKPPRSCPGTKSRPCGEQTTPTGKNVSHDSPSVCQPVSLPQPVRSRGPPCTGWLTSTAQGCSCAGLLPASVAAWSAVLSRLAWTLLRQQVVACIATSRSMCCCSSACCVLCTVSNIV